MLESVLGDLGVSTNAYLQNIRRYGVELSLSLRERRSEALAPAIAEFLQDLSPAIIQPCNTNVTFSSHIDNKFDIILSHFFSLMSR